MTSPDGSPTFPLRRTVLIALAVLLVPALAHAQRPKPQSEIGGDLRWLTGVQFNQVGAHETAFGGATRSVFQSSTSLAQAACPELKFIRNLTSVLDAEGSIALGRTELRTQITQDPEAANVTITEPVTAYLLEGGVAAHLARWRKGRAAPFASGGIGYLREIHDGQTLIEGGASWYVGGGLRFPPKNTTAHGLKSAALRLELRATILPGGSTLDGHTHVLPSLIGGVFFLL
jgi:hypothetical protein